MWIKSKKSSHQNIEYGGKKFLNITAQTSLAISRPGAETALRSSHIPILALCGTNDDQVAPQLNAIVAKMATKGQSSLLPSLGHYALLEDPEACANAVKNMMQKIKFL